MEGHSTDDISKVLETVRQITETNAHSAPKPEDIAKITEAYARLFPNVPNAASTTQVYTAYSTTTVSNGTESETIVYQTPRPEDISRIQEACSRLVPAESLQAVSQTTVHASPEAEEMLRAVINALSQSSAQSVQEAGKPAAAALVALQNALEGKSAPSQPVLEAYEQQKERSKAVWKTLYIVLGALIVGVLILTLILPGFGDGLKGLFQ